MKHYIDKNALVAEIERKLKELYKRKHREQLQSDIVEQMVYNEMLSIIDTLEVKDADLEHLEQEVKDFCYEYDDRKEKWYELCPNDRKLLYNPTWANFAMSIAKHFFELGISVNNKKHKGE